MMLIRREFVSWCRGAVKITVEALPRYSGTVSLPPLYMDLVLFRLGGEARRESINRALKYFILSFFSRVL